MNASMFWKRVNNLIKKRRSSQTELANTCGISHHIFMDWVLLNFVPPPDVANNIATNLDVNLDYLIYGNNWGKVRNNRIKRAFFLLDRTPDSVRQKAE